jgi:hypothetical protein
VFRLIKSQALGRPKDRIFPQPRRFSVGLAGNVFEYAGDFLQYIHLRMGYLACLHASDSSKQSSNSAIMTTLIEYTQIELLTLSGPEYRRVSTAPPRPPTDDEIPIIDLSSIDGDIEDRKAIASKIKSAAENTGFFYIKNHGIPEDLFQNALSQAQAFFNQPDEKKELVSSKKSKISDGWHGLGTTQVNKTETRGNFFV